MTMRNAVIVSGIFLAGLARRVDAPDREDSRQQDVREAPPLPALPKPGGENGLLPGDRASFYHLSEGGELFPLDWLLALDVEVPASDGSVHVRPISRQHRALRTAARRRQGLAIRTGCRSACRWRASKICGMEMIGLNCAACHVGQVQYQGHAVRIDGGGNMALRSTSSSSDLGAETEATVKTPHRLARFWDGCARCGASGGRRRARRSRRRRRRDVHAADHATLHAAIAACSKRRSGVLRERADAETLARRSAPTRATAGSMRSGSAATSCSAPSVPTACRPTRRSAFPHIWGMEYTGWLQWGANTNSVMERNIGQALGVGALFDAKTFESTVRLENLHQLETLAYKITPPKWPDTFPPIDMARAARGREHFYQHCAGCHETFKTDGRMRDLPALLARRGRHRSDDGDQLRAAGHARGRHDAAVSERRART